MFGYVTPLKSELKFKEFEYFRSIIVDYVMKLNESMVIFQDFV